MISATVHLFVYLCIGYAAAAPFTFPLSNGFPNFPYTDPALKQIETTAGGTVPNTPPPDQLNPETVNSFALIAFNEFFEIAFFTSLVQNITDNVEGFQLPPDTQQSTLATLNAVIAVGS